MQGSEEHCGVMASKHDDGHGGSITILEHGSTTTPMRFRMVMSDEIKPPAAERHPSQTEDFKVIRGTLDLGVIGGKRVTLRAGDTYHLPAGTYHLPSKVGDEELEFEAVLTPGMESADMFTDVYGVMREHSGFGRAARLAVVFQRYTSSIRFKPPFSVALKALASMARLTGAKAAKLTARAQ